MPLQPQFPEFQSAGSVPSSDHPWTVSGLTQYIKDLLELEPELQDLRLRGEISNLTRAASGHLYFTLKDSEAAIACVMWRSAAGRLSWGPQQGAAVVARGRISVYAPRGAYQFYVDELRPAGLGDLHARFEQLREQLKVEGLFDDERKRPLPTFPRVIGVVTSPQAAALRDALNVLRRRYPVARVRLAPTLVQGDGAPSQIVSALRELDSQEDVDLVLLIRGGGSLEELWAFNDERVARAIAACRHPVVTGVGHETDFTIADFVADLRAPTPSAAAELATPDQAELWERIEGWTTRLASSMERQLGQMRGSLEQQERALEHHSPQARVNTHRQQVDELSRRASRVLRHGLALKQSALEGLQARLQVLGPLATLERGYAIVRQEETGLVVQKVSQVRAGDPLKIRIRDGEFGAVADDRI
jgi:exodeoxyribonuclease VII large subunit